MPDNHLGEFAMWLALGAGQVAFWIALHPLIRALADRVARRGGGGERMELIEARLAALEQRGPVTGEVEAQDTRLGELEQRLDFAERILTQSRHALGQRAEDA